MTVDTAPARNAGPTKIEPPHTPRPNPSNPCRIATWFVPPEHVERIRTALAELRQIHTPESAEEAHLVERLALAQATLYDAAAAQEDRGRWLRANAAELFERHHQERFEADLKKWRQSPATMTETFGKTWHSARFLRDLWHAARDGVTDGLGLSFDQLRDMVTSLGGDWRADRIDIHRGRLFTLFLATLPEPGPVIERWVAESRSGRHDTSTHEDDIDRAHWFLANAPGPDDARDELARLADCQFQLWSAEADRLWALHRDERARCESGSPSQPLGTTADQRLTRQIQRHRTTAENRVDQFERRLLALRRNRSKTGHRPAVTTLPPSFTIASSDGSQQCSQPVGSHPGVAMKVCTTDKIDPHGDRVQRIDIKDDASPLRNGGRVEATPGSDPAEGSPEAVPTRRNQRPDAKSVARAWRQRANPGRTRDDRKRSDRASVTSGQANRPTE